MTVSFDVVAMASSAGGIPALSTIMKALPDDFPVGILIVQHLDPRHVSILPDILRRYTKLNVNQATSGERVLPGNVYTAPPDQHLLVNVDGVLELSHAAMVHFLRPSADLLFESVAAAYKDRAIAVVLSGSGSDGAMGVRAIKKVGGTVIAQDEQTSTHFGMPGKAIETRCVDFVLPVELIVPTLVQLIHSGGAA